MTIDVGQVGMISPADVVVDDRTREEMGDLDGFEENLKETGLISPLAVKDNKDGTYSLLAGERRFVILERNNVPQIPVRIFNRDLTKLEMKVIEKSENFWRKDMEYWEFDKLTLDIHRMQQELHGVKAPGPGTGWSAKDTADMLGFKDRASVTEAVKRAEIRESFPTMFEKCKTANDASKVVKKLDEAIIKETIVQKLKAKGLKGTTKKLSDSFILKDFFEGVKEIPDGIMHLVEIDPPYAIDLKERKQKKGAESQYQLEDYNEIDKEDYQTFLANVFSECYRVMTDHSWLIVWFAPEPWFENIYRELTNAGFQTNRMCGIWPKSQAQDNQPQIQLANAYESFFYAWKGRPVLNKPGRRNVFDEFPPIPAQSKCHPTERPIELTTEIYDTFAFPGARVLIPFLGSGNGLISAHRLGMNGVGFERGKAYKDSFLVKVHKMEMS